MKDNHYHYHLSIVQCSAHQALPITLMYVIICTVTERDMLTQVDDSKYSFAADEQDFRHPPVQPAVDGAAAEERDRLDDSSGSEGFCDQEPNTRAIPDFGRRGAEAEGAGRDSDSSDEGIKVR